VVRRGELWWYEPPDASRRPYLVLTRDATIPVLNQVLAVPATTTVRGIPTEVELDPRRDGVPRACALTLDNATLIWKSFCTQRIAALDVLRMRQVCEALRIASAC
jgi:mRNA interferase MazF